ncbi:hypothetical protein RSOLAG1IB_08151 [Rhizoctonia solani AG-1 IB]|uniref:Uncharacterized protein n=1 Tax=Thanatephorus cucumeris (strain AG1-IB / isolate 7/3/14) TaxID=1108050 RepID=A0A0B7FKV3_THACB|nr:hypothetical protein RSOLAG1IB_08151 [Rhizoctonia solani AG-1 IB]
MDDPRFSWVRPGRASEAHNAFPSVREIPTVAVPGNPNDPARETKFPIASYSCPVPPTEAETYRHSIAGWHSLLSPDDVVTEHELPLPTGHAARADRANTVPSAINTTSFDFTDLDRTQPPRSAPSQETTFNLQVTAEQPPSRVHQHPIPTSYDFIDMDHASPTPLPASTSSSESGSNSIRHTIAPSVNQPHLPISPVPGRRPSFSGGSQRGSSPARSNIPLQQASHGASASPPVANAPIPESYDFVEMDHTPTVHHENSEYGAYYCASPMPILTPGSAHGARTTYSQETGLSSVIGEMERYNRTHMPRSMLTSSASPTTTISVDGTLDSPYLDR